MAESENDLSVDDLLAAFGGSAPQRQTPSKSANSSSGRGETSSAPSMSEDEIDLLSALGIASSVAPSTSPSATSYGSQYEQPRSGADYDRRERENFKDAARREQQIRSQQWQQELRRREARIARMQPSDEASPSQDGLQAGYYSAPQPDAPFMEEGGLSKQPSTVKTSTHDDRREYVEGAFGQAEPYEPRQIPEPSFLSSREAVSGAGETPAFNGVADGVAEKSPAGFERAQGQSIPQSMPQGNLRSQMPTQPFAQRSEMQSQPDMRDRDQVQGFSQQASSQQMPSQGSSRVPQSQQTQVQDTEQAQQSYFQSQPQPQQPQTQPQPQQAFPSHTESQAQSQQNQQPYQPQQPTDAEAAHAQTSSQQPVVRPFGQDEPVRSISAMPDAQTLQPLNPIQAPQTQQQVSYEETEIQETAIETPSFQEREVKASVAEPAFDDQVNSAGSQPTPVSSAPQGEGVIKRSFFSTASSTPSIQRLDEIAPSADSASDEGSFVERKQVPLSASTDALSTGVLGSIQPFSSIQPLSGSASESAPQTSDSEFEEFKPQVSQFDGDANAFEGEKAPVFAETEAAVGVPFDEQAPLEQAPLSDVDDFAQPGHSDQSQDESFASTGAFVQGQDGLYQPTSSQIEPSVQPFEQPFEQGFEQTGYQDYSSVSQPMPMTTSEPVSGIDATQQSAQAMPVYDSTGQIVSQDAQATGAFTGSIDQSQATSPQQALPTMQVAPGMTPLPLAEDQLEIERQNAGSKRNNILGIILIVVALLCAVMAIGMLSGLFNMGAAPSSSSASSSAASSAQMSDVADDPNSTKAVYTYVVRGGDGTTHEATETASFNADGFLEGSTIELEVSDIDTANALLEQLKSEFGTSVVNSEADDAHVLIDLDINRDDLTKEAYTELLLANMTEFKQIS